jgi:NTE family protein
MRKRTLLPHHEYVIVGAGLAGATAAETLRHEGAQGRILLLSEEGHWPYQRPPLSKRFLTDDQNPAPVALFNETTVRELHIELRLSTRVASLDAPSHTLRTEAGETIRYQKLLIATGANPLRLTIPGVDLPGVHYLHSLSDALAMRKSVQSARRAVVIGGSFIGLEVASSLRRRGLEVTILERDELFSQLKTPLISRYFHQCFQQRGVDVLLGETPMAFRGRQRVQSVLTHTGRQLPCDMVVIGAGVVPATDFLRGCGLEMDQGIVVDRFLQSSHPDVLAAGDVAYFFDPVIGHHHRVEHWDNAVKQGRLAARNMLGKRQPYE